MEEESLKKKRIKSIIQLYYSRPEIQKAIFEFCKNREVVPRYFESFGKRPDALQYQGDIYELVKRGTTSFNCSEELWEDPLKISTEMTEKDYNELRIGWDLLIDVDCKWFDYAKKAAEAIVETLKRNGLKNIGIKFSGSKGFHILVPWKAFPKSINGIPTKELFPELPRNLINYIREHSERIFRENLPEDFEKEFKNVEIKKGIKCQNCNGISDIYIQVEMYCPFCKSGEIKRFIKGEERKNHKCPECNRQTVEKDLKEIYECKKCKINSLKNPEKFILSYEESDLFEIMGLDLILVSPRHLFRTPYSLHEKTALASVVLTEEEFKNFEIKDADPMKIKIRDFIPECKEEEAKELVMQTLDWVKSREIKGTSEEKNVSGKYANFKPIQLKEIKEDNFPPSIKYILNGLKDGKKRGLFVLLNFFRSIGMDKTELEKRIFEWNKKNETPLKEGYIQAQLVWSYRRKPIMPPNFNTDYYKALGISINSEEIKMKNPVTYMIKKTLGNSKNKDISKKS
ncbi:MAG: hypothetical protein WC812_04630 [Candidatus Pacearchaeota archaeon]|jgi:DNA primase catalytic subunit